MTYEVTADHLAGASAGGGFIPQAQNNFSLEINGLTGLRLSLKSCTLPTFRVNVGELNFENEKKRYVQSYEPTPMTVTIRDYIDQDIARKLYDWFVTEYDPKTGKIGKASAYKKEGRLILHGPDGGDERQWKLIGIFIEEFQMGEGDMDARGEPVLISVSLSVDKIEII